MARIVEEVSQESRPKHRDRQREDWRQQVEIEHIGPDGRVIPMPPSKSQNSKQAAPLNARDKGANNKKTPGPPAGLGTAAGLTVDIRNAEKTMAQLDALVGDIAGRFNLGANANSLVQEILRLITGSPGGIGGFLDRFKSAGLGPEVKTWLGHPDASPLLANQVDRALGSNTLGVIASKLGIGVSAASAIAGYTIPKLIGALTPGGIIPSKLSSDVLSFRPRRARTKFRPACLCDLR
jgi:uncharacterized protein YidB (DUF937 family)